MTDFTKKELVAMESAVYILIEKDFPVCLGTSPLLQKLQHMIDDFPEEVCAI